MYRKVLLSSALACLCLVVSADVVADDDPCIASGATSVGPCGVVSYEGCCAGDVVRWCQNGTLCELDCWTSYSAGCGWDSLEAYYFCSNSPAADPTGTHPWQCSACSPIGLCGDGELGYQGCCVDQSTVNWCEGGVRCELDCSVSSTAPFCGWQSTEGFYDCFESATSSPDSAFPYTCEETCVPDCGTKVCGDDGCGASCGSCPAGWACELALGQCQPPLCQPDCAGKSCGPDGCGGSCGLCSGAEICAQGVCITDCQPNCIGLLCGADGCGGTCGECPQGQSCLNGHCFNGPCEPECGDAVCGSDGCGGSCGLCASGLSCLDGQCLCEPNCPVGSCGADGCGGSCGACPGGEHCVGGFCQGACVPSCEGKVCGDDGCGATCGQCAAAEVCSDGVCHCEPQCAGMLCGDDGCGGSCGSCEPGAYCEDGQCVASCVPQCVGKECGADACGGLCGLCGTDEQCGADGLCRSLCEPVCDGQACGEDGCGGSCGQCPEGFSCIDGGCEEGCVPACEGRVCGDDSCGGSCGACADNLQCSGQGQCQPSAESGCSCEGRVCGDDGCGSSCGACAESEYCDGQGRCISAVPGATFEPIGQACPPGQHWDALVQQCVGSDAPGGADTESPQVVEGCRASSRSPGGLALYLLGVLLLCCRRCTQRLRT